LRRALVGYVAAIVVSSVTAAGAATLTGDIDGLAPLLAGQVGFWTVLVVTVAAARGSAAGTEPSTSLPIAFRWTDLPVGVALGAATQLALVPLLYLPFRSLIDEDDLSGPARELFDRVNGAGLAAMAVGVIIVAPIVEEVFFRGLLLGAMRARWGVSAAVIGSSLVFGATHFQPLQLPALAVAGAVFAGVAVRAGRLGPAIAVHAGFNATTFVALVLLG
jgi:membrane protease YdiL (CAAX protease family)